MRAMTLKLKEKIPLFLLCASLTTSYGQDQKASVEIPESVAARKRFISKVEFLLGSGPVFYRGSDNYKENDALKLGFSANLALVHKFTNRIRLNSVLAYEIKSAKLIYDAFDPYFNPPSIIKLIQNMTLHYATISLLPKYSFTKGDKSFIGGGPYFGYLHRTKVTTEYYVNGSLFSRSGTWPDPHIDNKLFDAGLAVMAGINIRGERMLKGSIQLMYKKGMVDINQPMITQMRNNTISVLLGITLK